MSESALREEIVGELKAIRQELVYIKNHMVDMDTLLSFDEEKRLEEAIKAHKEGKTVKLEDFERQMGR